MQNFGGQIRWRCASGVLPFPVLVAVAVVVLKFLFAGRGGNEGMSPKPIQKLLPGAESYVTIIWKGFSAVFRVVFTSIVDVDVK